MEATTMIAATVARTEAIRAEIQPLLDELERTRDQLRAQRSAHTRALKRAQAAEAELATLWAEIERNQAMVPGSPEIAPESPTIAYSAPFDEPDLSDYALAALTDPELVELRRLLADLKREDHETYAPAICAALNAVGRITVQLREAAGRPPRLGPGGRPVGRKVAAA